MRIPPSLRTQFLKTAIKNGLKLLTYDTETSHAIVRTFYIGNKVNIQHRQVKVPNKVITIQYKWAHESTARYLQWDKVDDKYDDARNFDDSSMIEEFATGVLAQADLVLTQNGDKFDFLVLNERAKALKLSILDQKPSLDILKLSRKSFRALSHKLDYRSEQQGLGGKIQMVDDDWVDVEERNVPVEKKMAPYGLKDTKDTEKLLWKELPYYKDLPVAVEKTVLKFLEKPEDKEPVPYCEHCRKGHRPSREIDKSKDGYICKNCKSNQHISFK
jgi:DNA polymerase elongation subunit (family B)